MSTIDEVKGKLTDGEYKTLCDKMMIFHKKEEAKMFPVKIWFMSVSSSYKKADVDVTNVYRLEPKVRIVLMNETQFQKHTSNIETYSTHVSDYSFNEPYYVDFFEHPTLDCVLTELVCTDECESCEIHQDHGAIYPERGGHYVKIYRIEKFNR